MRISSLHTLGLVFYARQVFTLDVVVFLLEWVWCFAAVGLLLSSCVCYVDYCPAACLAAAWPDVLRLFFFFFGEGSPLVILKAALVQRRMHNNNNNIIIIID